MQRRIIIDIDDTLGRMKFDVLINASGDESLHEGISREQVHNLVRETVNAALDSLA
jgi:hypothetical protein